jgi:hypothetical protein
VKHEATIGLHWTPKKYRLMADRAIALAGAVDRNFSVIRRGNINSVK